MLGESLIGKYVLVRCNDAGVHTGILCEIEGRSCLLKESRRLWYWKVLDRHCFLSGVAVHGLDKSSKVGETVSSILLTEDCEIIEISTAAEISIRGIPAYENK